MGIASYKSGFEVSLHPDRIDEPRKRIKPTVCFVNSMSDLFHEEVPFEFIDRVYDTMLATPQHRYQILTKRPERLAHYASLRQAPPNVWLGVSVENRRHGIPRIACLRGVQATIRFLSIEPLLEDLGKLNLAGLQWVIVGGESGSKARPMRPDWVRRVRDQCIVADVPFFFKQWGSVGPDGVRRSKSGNGCELDGRQWRQMPV